MHLISKYVGYQYYDNTSNSVRSLNPYFVNNLRLDYEVPVKKLDRVELQLLINNIFNSDIISNAYGGNFYVDGTEYSWAGYFPQAGINWLARLTVRF
jgi:iron complex outermembrane receptor protein